MLICTYTTIVGIFQFTIIALKSVLREKTDCYSKFKSINDNDVGTLLQL